MIYFAIIAIVVVCVMAAEAFYSVTKSNSRKSQIKRV